MTADNPFVGVLDGLEIELTAAEMGELAMFGYVENVVGVEVGL
jgi:hypothetical protein